MSKKLNLNDVLLLIIDIQEKLLPAQLNKECVLKNAQILAETASILKIPTIVSEQYPRGLGNTINELKEKLSKDSEILEKTSFSCCDDDKLLEAIKKHHKKQIIVSGMESHICVYQTVSQLLKEGYEVFIIQDAISSRKEFECNIGLTRMISEGAIASCTEMTIFELLKSAKHPNFKELQNLIK